MSGFGCGRTKDRTQVKPQLFTDLPDNVGHRKCRGMLAEVEYGPGNGGREFGKRILPVCISTTKVNDADFVDVS